MSKPIDLKAVRRALDQESGELGDTYKATPVGMWACSELEEVYDLFSQINLADYGHLVDLGSGDGRVVLAGSLFTRASGIEADPELVEVSRRAAESLGLSNATFIQGDCRHQDLSPYDVLYIYPDKPLDWLEQRLATDWPGMLVIYGPYFKPTTLKPRGSIYAGSTHCTLWSR